MRFLAGFVRKKTQQSHFVEKLSFTENKNLVIFRALKNIPDNRLSGKIVRKLSKYIKY